MRTFPLRRGTALLAFGLALGGIVMAASLATRSDAPAPFIATAEAGDDTMDMDLLHESMLKIWIIEESSTRHTQSRIAQKSFEGTLTLQPTGDPVVDKENATARAKLEKDLRFYIALELDGAIECVDIADRILGTKVAISAEAAEKRRFFLSPLPDIKWRAMSLDDAMQDLSRMLGKPVKFPKLPKTLSLEISYETPKGMPLMSVLDFIKGEHQIEWDYIPGGGLDVRYTGEIPVLRPGQR